MAAGITDLMWRGAETVAAAKSALARGAAVKLQLPAGYRHAVCARLGSRAAAQAAETLDVAGGAELLARIADIGGLEGVAELAAPAAHTRARVRVVSPSPTIAIVCERSAERGA